MNLSRWLMLLAIVCAFPVKSSRDFNNTLEKEDSRQIGSRHNGITGRILSIEDFGAIPDSALGVKETTFPEFFRDGIHLQSSYTFQTLKDSTRNVTELSLGNTAAFNKALRAAQSGTVVLVPDGKSYTFTGGILGQDLNGVTIDIAGSAHFVHDLQVWPFCNSTCGKDHGYLPCINIVDSRNITLTSSSKSRARTVVDYDKNQVYLDQNGGSGGTVNGNGNVWWDDAIFGRLPGKDGDARPRLIHVQSSADILVENLTLLNSPFWTLTVEAVRAEIRHVNVLVDRKYQARLLKSIGVTNKDHTGERDSLESLGKFPFPSGIPDWVGRRLHQPQDLNTDGIDPRGTNIWVHDCIIQNADDSVAVKPPSNANNTTALNGTLQYNCTRNITVENMVLTGFGASIGSVGPREDHPCVDSVVFRNITMPGTGKGIYIKSDHSDCNGGQTSQITNILYEDILMMSPFWWPIWIGPQQQHQPNVGLQGNCPLLYPLPGSKTCPTQGCATFDNITLRNIRIENPLVSPGVILGNKTNPIRNLVLDNVTVVNSIWKPFYGHWPFHEKQFPYKGEYQCIHAHGTCQKCQPAPQCLAEELG